MTAYEIIDRLVELLDEETEGQKPVKPKDWLILFREAKKWLKGNQEA